MWRRPGLTLGHISPWHFSPAVRLPQAERSGHLYVVGKTGKGKSKFLQACLYQDIVEGRGCGVIDPHADLIADLLAMLESHGFFKQEMNRDRVIYLDPADSALTVPFNVLATPGEPYEIAQHVIEAFRRAWPEALANAPHWTNIMLHALLLLIQVRQTLVDLPTLLLDKHQRDAWLNEAGDSELRAFFHQRFDQWGKQAPVMKESTLNKVTALTLNSHLRRMLGQHENRLDFRRILDKGRVLLVDLGHCDEESQRLIGNLVTTGIEQAAFSRHNLPPPARRPFYLYVDEFHDYSAGAVSSRTLAKILSGTRKFGLYLTLSHQNLGQLLPQTRSAVLGNVWTKVIFGVSEEDAHELARLIGLGNVDPETVKHAAQSQTQHPLYAPLPEQWHMWAALLANQKPRHAVVRDQQGRTRLFWTEKLHEYGLAARVIERLRLDALQRYAIGAESRTAPSQPRVADEWPSFEPLANAIDGAVVYNAHTLCRGRK
jgi:DNA helicase HerA-like ATPase